MDALHRFGINDRYCYKNVVISHFHVLGFSLRLGDGYLGFVFSTLVLLLLPVFGIVYCWESWIILQFEFIFNIRAELCERAWYLQVRRDHRQFPRKRVDRFGIRLVVPLVLLAIFLLVASLVMLVLANRQHYRQHYH